MVLKTRDTPGKDRDREKGEKKDHFMIRTLEEKGERRLEKNYIYVNMWYSHQSVISPTAQEDIRTSVTKTATN